MADGQWKQVRRGFGDASLTLGPYFAYQALNYPRHMLFTFARYKFAARLLAPMGKSDVLELGCGEGLGTLLLAEDGHNVTAVDSDESAIAHAGQTLSHANITFEAADFLDKRLGDFDAVVCLDVIEHIQKEREADFFRTVCRNLRESGFAVIGTPNETASPYASEASRIGHVNLYSAERLAQSVRAWFRNVFIFGMNDEVVHTGFYPMCQYLFALGCGKRV